MISAVERAGFAAPRTPCSIRRTPRLTYEGERIALTKNEYRILLRPLMENKGKVVSRERLMERLWETDEFCR